VSAVTVRLDESAIRKWSGSRDADEVLTDLGKLWVADAKRDAPKRTGEMADSIDYELGHDSKGSYVRVSWDEEHFYGVFVETGTSEVPARPFLRPAALTRRSL
jgi:HK97 gp10 family phage protein